MVMDVTGPSITLYKENSLLNKMRNPRKIMPTQSLNEFVPITDLAYRDELQDFFDCIANHRKPVCDARAGFTALRIAEAAKESHFTNRIVEITNEPKS
jgi:predicted dehydrogenase